jgi:hypothetical protein
VQNKIHKQKILSDTRTDILGSIAGPCDILPAQSDEFQKVCVIIFENMAGRVFIVPITDSV